MKLVTYVKESIAELKKVSWPTKRQTMMYTIIVLVMSVGMAILFSVLDQIFNLGLKNLI
ncbi:MAG: preprotein translocase subunit SecE [Candidatus Magasanikbacteria bacterium]|nr:preprotein translocase subunit SecE [Candidatus Magasanikbacteria bacterium]